jgi:hypothetical protein
VDLEIHRDLNTKTAYNSSVQNLFCLPVCHPQLKVKVKITLEQATKAQRGSRGIALLFHLPRRQMGWVVNATPRPLYPQERPGTHFIRGWVGPQGRSGETRKISLPPGFDSQTLQPVTSRYTD